MDVDFILLYLIQHGIDPSICVVGQKHFQNHQLQALALYIATNGRCANFGQMRTGKTPPTILYAYWAILQKQVDCCIAVVPNQNKWLWQTEIGKVLPEWVTSLVKVVEGTKVKKKDAWESYQ